jgi:hypothetical protein
MAMTDAERQRKRREKLRASSTKVLLVRAAGGYFDERIRVSLAVRKLALEGLISKDIIELIAKTSETVFDTDKLSDRKFVNKIVTEYLSELN